YWEAMQAVIRKYDIHFHADEVVCGFGRTGYRWGAQAFNLQPDSTSCAKALTAAFFPMSALMFKEDFYQDMMRNSDEAGVLGHGYTYSGHPVGAAIALEALDIYEDIDLLGHVREVSTGFREGCRNLMDHPLVGDARGIGLFCGIQLVKNKTTRETFDPALKIGQRVQDAAHANGLYLRAIPPDRISFMPPLIIEQSEIDDALKILRKALDIVWSEIR
ncbi:MAG: aminotransferase class III-fold pyridoxal phosphate-dependent enzyme, partial [Gammaproteobacteria bacterium]